ncbi:MAG: ABC-F family ATP-binding cassette domain-containing protein [Propionibacteriaceae bacterium]|jgi:ATPase subunit of ABC transporter with duplicated ATPase domains|nr:ABC-F family ATP-binding cassette domain-containing protein [Propionibacteriaceae bacterium]
MAHLLSGEKIGLEYPTTTVLTQVTCGIDDGDRVGIVGRNGDGKSSLLGILSGRLQPTSGKVTHRSGLRVGFFGQEEAPNPDSHTVEQAIFGGRPRYEWASNAFMRGIVDGLVASIGLDADLRELSGGESRKVGLACVLVEDWDVLALDEPTNHLDLEAIIWLAEHLKTRWISSKGGLLLVTHDRWFLDEVAQTTWEIHDGCVDPFSGGYAAYVLARVERDRQAMVAENKRRNLMRKELAWLRRGPPARTSKTRFRIEAANSLIADVPEIRNTTQLKKMAIARLGKKVIDLVDVSFSYPSESGADAPMILDNVTWRIAPGERTGILGLNGAGKSTLLSLMDGRLSPTQGRVTTGRSVRLAVLDQANSVLDEFRDEMVSHVVGNLKTVFQVEGKEMSPGQLLEQLGFSSAHLSARIGQLSGGQKRRLQILLVLCQEPNVLILDEPTNDVDTEMLTALEDLLDTWPGTLIVVSHDRYFMERVTDQQYAVIDSRLRHLPGGIDEYMRLVRTKDDKEDPAKPKSTETASSQHRVLRKQLGTLENRLARIEETMAALHDHMGATDPTDWVILQDLMAKVEAAKAEREAVEEEWLEIGARLEGQ